MKALWIVLGLVAALAAALFFLFQDSHADLRRLEASARSELDEARGHLNACTAALAALRAIRPQMLRLDERLTELRHAADALDRRLTDLARARPEASTARQPLLEERDLAKRQAGELKDACADFRGRVELLDEFVRGTEPLVTQMMANAGALFARRDALTAVRRADADALLVRLDQLGSEAAGTQRLAGQVLETSTTDVSQARVLAGTVEREVKRVLAEQKAIGEQVAAALAAP